MFQGNRRNQAKKKTPMTKRQIIEVDVKEIFISEFIVSHNKKKINKKMVPPYRIFLVEISKALELKTEKNGA